MRPVEIEVYKERQTVPFSILDRTPQYIRPGASSYWNYLTLDAYKIYEKIYGLCVSPNSTSGMVHGIFEKNLTKFHRAFC
jgi:calcium-independent phospholipase A2-gamma